MKEDKGQSSHIIDFMIYLKDEVINFPKPFISSLYLSNNEYVYSVAFSFEKKTI